MNTLFHVDASFSIKVNTLWKVAKKTKGLRAKPMVNLIVDKGVFAKFLIDTLEAKEPVSADTMFCIGETHDAWQQTPKKLLQKYTVEDIDSDGWMVCKPKPDNSVEFIEVNQDFIDCYPSYDVNDKKYIRGQWGETIENECNLQEFTEGDFIVRNRTDHSDIWVVRRKIWLNSYTEITEN